MSIRTTEPPEVESSTVEALALAVVADPASPRALVITESNDPDRWVPLAEALVSGSTFAVKVAPWVLALDADTLDGARELAAIAADLTDHGYRPVVVASGQPDHRHLFAVIADPAELDRRKAVARRRGLDVRDRGSLIRPPLSPHRLGLSVALMAPTDPAEALDALRRPLRGLPSTSSRRSLTPRMSALLRHGPSDDETRYRRPDGTRDRSSVVQALATGAVNAGWPFPQWLAAMLDPRNLGGARLREHPNPERYAHQSWAKAVVWTAERPALGSKADALAELDAIRAEVLAHPWRGREGGTDRSVMLAHIAIAERCGSVSAYNASVRTIAVEAGVSTDTVGRSHDRLMADGWVRRQRKGSGSTASRWEFLSRCARAYLTPPEGELDTCSLRDQSRRIEPHLDAGADAYRWSALGKHAPRTLDYLTQHRETSAPALAADLGISRGTAWRQLKTLAELGLVSPRPDPHDRRRTLYRLSVAAETLPAELEAVAEGHGTRGRRDAERELYRRTVEARRSEVARYVAEHPAPSPRLSVAQPDDPEPDAAQPDEPLSLFAPDELAAIGPPHRGCERCGDPLPREARSDARYCSASCRGLSWRSERKTGDVA